MHRKNLQPFSTSFQPVPLIAHGKKTTCAGCREEDKEDQIEFEELQGYWG